MKSGQVSRRVVFGALGAGAVATAATATRSAHSRPGSPGAAPVEAQALPDSVVTSLVAPLAAGSQLAGWDVVQVLPLAGGAASVVLRDSAGRPFQLDVCARDEATVVPARSELFDVSVANRGDGTTATTEEHGLAAMALAEVLRSNEHSVDLAPFRTINERAARGAARRHVGA